MARYALSDLHGRLDLFLKIKEFLQPDDIVYFLGDAGDRGFNGWEIIKQIYENPQFIYLKGNHEDMLVKAIRAYRENAEIPSMAYIHLYQNGGAYTFEDWWKDGADKTWANKLDQLPLHAEFVNNNGQLILLSHAGYTPWSYINEPSTLASLPSQKELLWDRDHLYDDWSEEECVKNSIVVHGHTTLPSLFKRLSIKEPVPVGAYWYFNNHKVDIDNYSAGTGKACLLNLDTLEAIVIEA